MASAEERLKKIEDALEVLIAFNPILMSEIRTESKEAHKKLKNKVRLRAIKQKLEIETTNG